MFCIHITVALLLQLIKLQLRHTVSYDLGTHCRILHHHLSTSLCICWVISDDRQGRHQSKYFFPHCNITEWWPGVYHVMLIQRWEVIAECWQCRVFTALHGRGGAEWGLWVGGDLVTWGQGWCCVVASVGDGADVRGSAAHSSGRGIDLCCCCWHGAAATGGSAKTQPQPTNIWTRGQKQSVSTVEQSSVSKQYNVLGRRLGQY